jgi:hypothetical protein
MLMLVVSEVASIVSESRARSAGCAGSERSPAVVFIGVMGCVTAMVNVARVSCAGGGLIILIRPRPKSISTSDGTV